MHIAILTFDGFNELDSLIALGMLNRVRDAGWRVSLACPARCREAAGGCLGECPPGMRRWLIGLGSMLRR